MVPGVAGLTEPWDMEKNDLHENLKKSIIHVGKYTTNTWILWVGGVGGWEDWNV